MANLIEKLTAEGEGEPASKSVISLAPLLTCCPKRAVPYQPPTGFLNDIITHLWPHIQVAGSQMIKDIVEPMFKTMLPGPLATLHFTKIELGATPITVSNVKVTKTPHDGIKLDLNVDWGGQCDIQLDGQMIPKVVSFAARRAGEFAGRERES
jgi:hypothetical protein